MFHSQHFTAMTFTGICLAAAVSSTALAAPITQIESGHIDLAFYYDGQSLTSQADVDAGGEVDGQVIPTGQAFAPGEAVFVLPQNAASYLDSSPIAFPHLDVSAGDEVWFIQQSNNQTQQPWVGFSTEDASVNPFSSITVQLDSIDMPDGAEFALWQSGSFGGATVFFSTVDEFTSTTPLQLSYGTHAHYNWGFTKPGDYELTFTAEGTLAGSGDIVTMEEATYLFHVVPEPTSLALLGMGAATMLIRRRHGKPA